MAVKFQDYYKILGLKRNATEKDIRDAYRKLARNHHPDLQPPDKKDAAEKKFKEINEAYEVLKDADKRAKYDRLGPNWQHGDDFAAYQQQWAGDPGRVRRDFGDGFEGFSFSFGGGEGGGASFSDFFRSIFGEGFGEEDLRRTARTARTGRPRRGVDVEAELEVELEDIFHGREKQFQINLQDLCTACGGSGHSGHSICNLCGGSGHQRGTKTIKLKIPQDARDGRKIRLKKQGGEAEPGGERGDLYLKIKAAPHPVFSVKGDDLEAELIVYPWQAALGDRVTAPALDGKVKVTIPPRTHTGYRLRLKNKGMPVKNGIKGDLYLRVTVDIPPELRPGEEELYRKMAQIYQQGA